MREGRGPQAGQGTKTAAMTLGRGTSPEAIRRGGGGLLPAGLLLPVLLMLAGCDGPQSALDVAGHEARAVADRSEEHTSELQSLMRISYAVFCLKNKKTYR